jgi:hypothetical protein
VGDVSAILEYVSLALYDHGPLTASDLATITCIPMPSLIMHLSLNRGTRYLARLTIEAGLPVRRWELAPADHTQETEE